MHTTTTRRRFRLQKQTFSKPIWRPCCGHIGFLGSPSLCQFMPVVSETTDSRKHFDIDDTSCCTWGVGGGRGAGVWGGGGGGGVVG